MRLNRRQTTCLIKLNSFSDIDLTAKDLKENKHTLNALTRAGVVSRIHNYRADKSKYYTYRINPVGLNYLSGL